MSALRAIVAAIVVASIAILIARGNGYHVYVIALVGLTAIVGIGLNVTLREAELPRPDATSLQLAGASCVDRDPLLRAVLRGVADWYGRWRDAGGDAVQSGLVDTYRLHCATIGATVRVTLPGGAELTDIATGVADDGALIVGGHRVAAGDVIHVRAASG